MNIPLGNDDSIIIDQSNKKIKRDKIIVGGKTHKHIKKDKKKG